MGRRPLSQRNIRSITKLGKKSYAVTIPIDQIRKLGWREKQKVVVTISKNRVIITDYED